MRTPRVRAVAMVLLVVSATAVVRAPPVGAGGGTLDTTFVNPAVVGGVFEVDRASDGDLYIAGEISEVAGADRDAVARLNANGTLDAAFAPPAINNEVNGLEALPTGRVLIGGGFTMVGTATRNGLARLRPNGSVDPTFPDPGVANGSVFTIARLPDGRLLIGGTFNEVDGRPRLRLARLHPNGSLDLSFPNPDIDGTVRSIVVLGSGKILVAGNFTHVDGVNRGRVARLNANGSLDQTFFDPIANNQVNQIIPLPGGKSLIAGEFGVVGFGVQRAHVARLNANGTPDEGFANPQVSGSVFAIARIRDGRILIGGDFGAVGTGASTPFLERLIQVGLVDHTFGTPQLNGGVRDIELLSDGRVLIAGAFNSAGGQPRARVARLKGVPLCDGRVVTVDLEAGEIPNNANNVILGDHFANLPTAKAGDDRFCGLAGGDRPLMGPGADRAFGQSGNDRLVGDDGNDLLVGSVGNDQLFGGPGVDVCRGGPGTDTATGCETVTGVP